MNIWQFCNGVRLTLAYASLFTGVSAVIAMTVGHFELAVKLMLFGAYQAAITPTRDFRVGWVKERIECD